MYGPLKPASYHNRNAREPVLFAKEAIMECDICGQDVENSEELEKHKEQMHPPDKSADSLETPDLLGDTPDESAARENPNPTH